MIYIENFPTNLGKVELTTLFERFGSVALVALRQGAGLVRMTDREAALDAILHLNGRFLNDCRLRVGSTQGQRRR